MTSDTLDSPSKPRVWTLPNQLTAARLGLSIVLFVAMSFGWYALGFVLFVVAASTDWLDGYFARRWGLVTQLGRILDPFADKLIICGTFIYLAAIPASGITPWMAVVVMGAKCSSPGSAASWNNAAKISPRRCPARSRWCCSAWPPE
ncbi:MAG: CDP-alcohol phosphatidyltransferase family protein [Pirellulales bacterium]